MSEMPVQAEPHGGRADATVWLTAVGASMLVSASVLAAFYFFLLAPRQAPVIAKVDLPNVVEEQRKAFLDLVSKGKAEESARFALESARALNEAVARLGAECGCVLVVGDAVLHGAQDLTPRLRQILDEAGRAAAEQSGVEGR